MVSKEQEGQKHWIKVFGALKEAQKRWYAAQKAIELGRGGVTRVCELTGLSRTTVVKGMKELRSNRSLVPPDRQRRPGAGRKRLSETDPSLLRDVESLLEETSAGDPMKVLRWTVKSVRTITEEMNRGGHQVGRMSIYRLLDELEYTLQGNFRTKEGSDHPDRDRQFRAIERMAKEFLRAGDPVISVDAKKRELVGEFKNNGREWRKKGQRRNVNAKDFRSMAEGVAIPYGTYDVTRNEGFVNVGMSRETAEFAVESIRQWWRRLGREQYANAKRLLICADGGGGNGSRVRLWKYKLQGFANEAGLAVSVCHYPPGASKWNKIEHRLFSHISVNWRGQPLVTYEAVVNLISNTKTRKGLRVHARLDEKEYATGIEVSDEEMKSIAIEHARTLPKWNYTISPKK